MQYFLKDNRERQEKAKNGTSEDLYIPFNAGRQLNKVTSRTQGSFLNERPSNLVSLKEWIRDRISTGDFPGGLGLRYSISNGAYVWASTLGVTSTLENGVMTVISPEYSQGRELAKSVIYKMEMFGDSNALDSDGNLTIRYDYQWDTSYNDSLTNIVLPTITVWNMTLPNYAAMSTDFPAVQTFSTPPTSNIVYVQDNDLYLKIEGLNVIDNWAIAINF